MEHGQEGVAQGCCFLDSAADGTWVPVSDCENKAEMLVNSVTSVDRGGPGACWSSINGTVSGVGGLGLQHKVSMVLA
jgi:hypothetical protein